MSNTQAEQGHRRFLKGGPREPYKIGGYFPESLSTGHDEQSVDVSWIRNVQCGTIVFTMSPNCSSCDFNPITEYVMNHPKFNYLLLFDGHQDSLEEYRKQFNFSFPMIQCSALQARNQLSIEIVPWVLALNKIGQIVSAGLFNHSQHLAMITAPLIKVYYPDRILN